MTPRQRDVGAMEHDGRIVVKAVDVLLRGEVIAIPTDTVYGFAAMVNDPAAIEAIYRLKGRSEDKAIPVLLSDAAGLGLVSPAMPEPGRALAEAFWPGALTMVVPARAELAPGITSVDRRGRRTVAIRVPDHDLARSIIRSAGGALAVTSANRSGEAPALCAEELRGFAFGAPGLIVEGRATGGVASTVIAFDGERIEILREGAISQEVLQNGLSGCGVGAGLYRVVAV